LTNYVEHLQPELIVNYCKLVIVSVDSPMLSKDIKDGLGATFPFLSDEDKKVITELEIVDTTDKYSPSRHSLHFCSGSRSHHLQNL